MTIASAALLAEYERLWREFREGPHRVGPDIPPRQVCFDIQRVEDELKASGIADPFSLIRKGYDALDYAEPADVLEGITDVDLPPLEEPKPTAPKASRQPAQLALF